ncbi:LysR family transcriptional regulator [Pigmentiphaga litoralis]|uniref:LysR substrate-binding domain-containing protein n=1 Tax=Pigmentiphaga litoralis TaxID=516702 RepID=UPI0016745CF2|nr:LysR substrate-binding domain-containing protein [Pigmentiphaga litoralis]GGX21568.1 LysR family transcriptional regulator [Pigmentiphaga litoralis]
MLDLKSLKLFLVLAEELHYGRAAQRLHMSQPSLTKHIQQLEARLGVQVFERNKRSVRLTPAGRELVQEARRLITAAERSLRAVQRAERGEIGRIRIGFVAAVLFMGIERLVQRIEHDLPGVESAWEEMGSHEQLEALQQDRLDLGFGQMSQVGEMRSHVVARVPLVVALPDTHRLADKPEIDLSALVDDAFIAIPRQSAPTFHDLSVSVCMAAGFSPNILHSAKHLVSIVSLVAMGRGVSLVPESFSRAAVPGVCFKPIHGCDARAEFSVVWNPRSTLPVLPRVLQVLGAQDI